MLVMGLPELDNIMDVACVFQAELELAAFEFFPERALSLVVADTALSRPWPDPTPYYVLLEVDTGHAGVAEAVERCFQHCLDQGWVSDGVLSQSQAQAKSLWRLREDISESLVPWMPFKNDLAVAPSMVPGFLKEVENLTARLYPDFEVLTYGHIGDGNLHLNILKPPALTLAEFQSHCDKVSEELYSLVQARGGSISAEHGIGLLKRGYLSYSRGPEEIRLMRQVKSIFDPRGIMNPGKIFMEEA